MGRFPLVALRTLPEHDRVKAVMRAPLRRARLGVPSFGICHCRYRVPLVLPAAPRVTSTVTRLNV